ncbi:MAG: polysaccharide biosynthesis/export family protein [Cyclobacteriaceae bacterium]
MKILKGMVLFLALLVCASSCKMYYQDILFQLDDDFTAEDLNERVFLMERNYLIKPNDILMLDVFTNDGERIIDPNNELGMGQGGQQNRMNQNQNQNQNGQNINSYLVQNSGEIKVPVVGMVNVVGKTLIDAETQLQELFNVYYKGSYVRLSFSNKRVFVLGANGGQVIPIQNENTTLLEVLTLYGGFDFGSKANNIKVIRGDPTNPQIFMVDLTSVSAMKMSIVSINPGDVIYVEPWRRPVYQSIRDVSPILSLISSVIALTFVFTSL